MKRLFDLVGAAVCLIMLAPILVVVAALIRVVEGPPVLFKQVRAGLGGSPFVLYKFRTMREERNERGELLSDAERLSRIGRFLRRTSLDEIPELWNVIKGDMSLVGPRPLLPEYLPLYSPKQARRHNVKPGITGWAQVNGRNAINWGQKLDLDVCYVKQRSLTLDLKILVLTVWRVLLREGIQQPGQATAERFRGNVE